MKRIIMCLIVLSVLGGTVAADEPRDELFTQDARVMAMGGYTAVADDINALFFNPAGLAFLPDSDFLLGFTFYGDLVGEGIDYFADENDNNNNNDEPVLPVRYMSLTSRAAFADRNWGVAAISDIGVEAGEPENEDEIPYKQSHKVGLVGGLGLSSGPFAVGGNLRLYRTLFIDDKTLPIGEEPELEEIVENLREGIFDFKEDYNMEVGVGAMVTLGNLTAGAYIDKFLDVMEHEEHVFDNAWKSASVGVAYTPFENRLYHPARDYVMNLIVAGDLNYIGDEQRRSMSVGSEIGLNLGKLLQFNVRGGYRQPLPGELFEADIDTDIGEVFFGFGAKVLALDLNVSAAVPATFVRDLEENEDDIQFGENDPRISISGGLRL